MDKPIKNTIGIMLVIALLVASYGIFSYVRSFSQSSATNSPSLSVSGQGEVAAAPDVAKFSFGVITQGDLNVAALQSENTNKVNQIIGFLKAEGIDEKDIKTTSYNITPRQDFSPRTLESFRRVGEIVGYTVTQNVEVTVRDFSQIGGLLAGATEAGANSVSNFRFTFDDPIEIENEARTLAMAEAKQKAKLIAKAGGFRLGRLLSVDQGGYLSVGRFAFPAAEAAFDQAIAPAPQIEPGSEKIVVNVNLRYEIKD